MAAIDRLINDLTNNSSQKTIAPQAFEENGFIVPPIPSADGTGLQSSKIKSGRVATFKRQMCHWFVPEVGIVNMYINPQSITYNFEKLISQEKTKGGFLLQYWGEALPTLRINGHTGSSGVEGLNVLYEVYRAEQTTFDAVGLSLAANNSISGINDLIDGAIGNLGGLGGSVASVTSGLFGLSPESQSLLPQNVPSLAALAFGVELYFSGWVFRGYFKSFSFTESVNELGLFPYNIDFVVTQRRGYRINNMAWQRSATSGPSNSDAIPLSVSKLAK